MSCDAAAAVARAAEGCGMSPVANKFERGATREGYPNAHTPKTRPSPVSATSIINMLPPTASPRATSFQVNNVAHLWRRGARGWWVCRIQGKRGTPFCCSRSVSCCSSLRPVSPPSVRAVCCVRSRTDCCAGCGQPRCASGG